MELKPATEVSTAMPTEKEKGVREARTTTEVSEKRPHTPRSGIVLKKAEEVQRHDVGEKALTENLQTMLMMLNSQIICRRRAASQAHPGRGRKGSGWTKIS